MKHGRANGARNQTHAGTTTTRLSKGRGLGLAWLGAALVAGLGACAVPSAGDEGPGVMGDADDAFGGAARALDLTDDLLPTDCPGAANCRPPLLPRLCLPGTCDAGSGNGRGVYVAQEGNYCLGGETSDKKRFCPETFVNRTDGVGLRFRLPAYVDQFISARLLATLSQGPLSPEVAVKVLGLDVNEGKLRVRYQKPPLLNVFVAEGKALSNLHFRLVFDPGEGGQPARVPYDMRVEPDDSNDLPSPEGIYRYVVRFKPASDSVWSRHCGLPQKLLASSFVSGEVIDSVTAEVSNTNAITMSCETGAIDTCLAWGYLPWSTAKTGNIEASKYLFRSCLQAKRAAYFVGLGDTRSFTIENTQIKLRDRYGIRHDPIDETNIEALWSPLGAECLSHVRHPGLVGNLAGQLPACTSLQWSNSGWLATGFVPPP